MKKALTAIFAVLIFSTTTHAYSDTDSSYAKSEIDNLSAQGWIEGYEDNTFRPEDPINRAEFLKLTMIMASDLGILNQELEGTDCFHDVREQWFAQYICTAKALRYVSGYDDNYFRPEQTINYVEAAKIMSEVLKLEKVSEDDYVDPPWYLTYSYRMGNINAISPAVITFDQTLTRQDVAFMLDRIRTNKGKEKEEIPGPYYQTSELTDLPIWQSWEGLELIKANPIIYKRNEDYYYSEFQQKFASEPTYGFRSFSNFTEAFEEVKMDLETLEVTDNMNFLKDKTSLILIGRNKNGRMAAKRLPEIDKNSFEMLGTQVYQDKNHLYYMDGSFEDLNLTVIENVTSGEWKKLQYGHFYHKEQKYYYHNEGKFTELGTFPEEPKLKLVRYGNTSNYIGANEKLFLEKDKELTEMPEINAANFRLIDQDQDTITYDLYRDEQNFYLVTEEQEIYTEAVGDKKQISWRIFQGSDGIYYLKPAKNKIFHKIPNSDNLQLKSLTTYISGAGDSLLFLSKENELYEFDRINITLDKVESNAPFADFEHISDGVFKGPDSLYIYSPETDSIIIPEDIAEISADMDKMKLTLAISDNILIDHGEKVFLFSDGTELFFKEEFDNDLENLGDEYDDEEELAEDFILYVDNLARDDELAPKFSELLNWSTEELTDLFYGHKEFAFESWN